MDWIPNELICSIFSYVTDPYTISQLLMVSWYIRELTINYIQQIQCQDRSIPAELVIKLTSVTIVNPTIEINDHQQLISLMHHPALKSANLDISKLSSCDYRYMNLIALNEICKEIVDCNKHLKIRMNSDFILMAGNQLIINQDVKYWNYLEVNEMIMNKYLSSLRSFYERYDQAQCIRYYSDYSILQETVNMTEQTILNDQIHDHNPLLRMLQTAEIVTVDSFFPCQCQFINLIMRTFITSNYLTYWIQWILDHYPNVTTVGGGCNSISELNDSLRQVTHKITTIIIFTGYSKTETFPTTISNGQIKLLVYSSYCDYFTYKISQQRFNCLVV